MDQIPCRPALSNCYPTISTTTDNSTLIVITAENQIHIYNGKFNLLQRIILANVKCATIQRTSGLICASTGTELLFYKQTKPHIWELEFNFHYSHQITCLDWSVCDNLLVGGNITTVFSLIRNSGHPQLVPEFVTNLPYTPAKCIYSPCGLYFALYGINENTVLIWYRRSHGKYDFLFLPHGDQVLDIKWRVVDKQRNCVNVLMTTGSDKIARLWSETDQGCGFRSFDLAGVVDPTKYLFGNFPSETSSSNASNHINWLTGGALYFALDLHAKSKQFNDTLGRPVKSNLLESIQEYPDMVYQIRKNGTMIIWGIQGLGAIPRRVTKVVVILKTENTISASDYLYFDHEAISICKDPLQNFTDSPEIVFLAHNQSNGVLNAYLMNLTDFFNQNWTSPRLDLIYLWSGPSNGVKTAIAHPVKSLVILEDSSNALMVYSSNSHTVFGYELAFKLFGSLHSEQKVSVYCWVPSVINISLIIATEDSLLALSIHPELGQKVCVGLDFEMDGLFAYPTGEDDNFIVIGLNSKLGRIQIWNLFIDKEGCYSFSKIKELLVSPFSKSFGLQRFQFLSGHVCDNPVWLATISHSSVTLWGYIEKEFKELDVFQIPERHLPSQTKFSVYGKLAIVVDNIVEIWDNTGTGVSMVLEDKIIIKEGSPAGIDWYLTSGGQNLLVVAVKKSIRVYIESQSHEITCKSCWILVSEFNFPESNDIESIQWLPGGAILGSNGVCNFVIGPRKHKDFISKEIEDVSIFDLVSKYSARLPDTDPRLLLEYMIGDREFVVQYSLSLLYRFAKLAVDKNTTLENLPLALWKVVEKDSGYSEKAGYDNLFNIEDDEVAATLGQFSKHQSDFLCEHLESINFPDANILISFINAYSELNLHKSSLDRNGARFLISALFKINSGKIQNITEREYIWARFSDSQEYLIEILTKALGGKLVWDDAKYLGIALWVKNSATLKGTFETIARNQYWGKDGTNDPVECSLFYLALKKKNVLTGLWKVANGHPEQAKMINFLGNNFSEDRWKTAASKNAFALLGKQRFRYAASFFLLGDSLKDAISVCVKQLDDAQLALYICRIYEGDCGPVYCSELQSQLYKIACNNGNRWLTSLLWDLNSNSTNVMEALTESPGKIPGCGENCTHHPVIDPQSYFLYLFLKDHLKIQKYRKLVMNPFKERNFFLDCARSYNILGYPFMALQLIEQLQLDKFPEYEIIHNTQISTNQSDKNNQEDLKPAIIENDDIFDTKVEKKVSLNWDELETTKNNVSLDWGELESKKPIVELDWGELETANKSNEIDWEELETKPASNEVEREELNNNEDEIQALGKRTSLINLQQSEKPFITSEEAGIINMQRFPEDGSTVIKFQKFYSNNESLNEYFIEFARGLTVLSKLIELDCDRLFQILWKRSFETNSIHSFIEILKFKVNPETFMNFGENILKHQSQYLCRKSIEMKLWDLVELDQKSVASISCDLLHCWIKWNSIFPQTKSNCNEPLLSEVLVSGIVTQLMVSIKENRANQLWWMLGLSEQFFDSLLNCNLKSLKEMLFDILSGKQPAAHPEETDISSYKDELYDEFGIPMFVRDSPETRTAENMLKRVLLGYFTGAFKKYLEKLTEIANVKPELSITHDFLSQILLKGIVSYLYDLDQAISVEWKKHRMHIDKVSIYLFESTMKDLWSLIARTVDRQDILLTVQPFEQKSQD